MKNDIGKSIRMRLLNLAHREKQEYMKVLIRYFHERLLYRIGISPYRKHFLLKGSSLLFAYDRFHSRPTIDIDLLGNHINRDNSHLHDVFTQLCAIECVADGVTFDANTLKLTPIALEKKYPGACITVTAYLDTIVQPVSIDIGFGDVVTPYPLPLDYPLLLNDLPPVELYAYSLETLIAEKFHTMVDRDESNSRMKDFFDVYYIFKNHQVDSNTLAEAVKNTFRNRGTNYHDRLKLFLPEFAMDKSRNMQWQAFLRKIRWKETVAFSEVMESIRMNLGVYCNQDLNKD